MLTDWLCALDGNLPICSIQRLTHAYGDSHTAGVVKVYVRLTLSLLQTELCLTRKKLFSALLLIVKNRKRQTNAGETEFLVNFHSTALCAVSCLCKDPVPFFAKVLRSPLLENLWPFLDSIDWLENPSPLFSSYLLRYDKACSFLLQSDVFVALGNVICDCKNFKVSWPLCRAKRQNFLSTESFFKSTNKTMLIK